MGKGMKAAGKKAKKSFNLRKDIHVYESTQRKIELNRIKKDMVDQFTDVLMYQHNIDMLSVLFALRDEFKFGKDRLVRTLKKASMHADTMFLNGDSVDEMLDILKQETGVTEKDLVFRNEIVIDDDGSISEVAKK